MKHNIFLPLDWETWKIGKVIKYRAALDIFGHTTFANRYVRDDFAAAMSMTAEHIKERVCPVVDTINALGCDESYSGATFRVIAGIVLVLDPSITEARMKAKIELWLEDNWKPPESTSPFSWSSWINNNLDRHGTSSVGYNQPYPRYIDLRKIKG